MASTLTVKDANDLDQRIPRNLMMSFEGKPFVLKAGLEWKANQLFGLGKWSLETEIIQNDQANQYVVVKARVLYKKQVWENFGEASKLNTKPQMLKYLLHLAITRAEARALRVATACGYTSVEELDENKAQDVVRGQVEVIEVVNDSPIEDVDTEAWLDCTCHTSGKYHAKDCPLFETQSQGGHG